MKTYTVDLASVRTLYDLHMYLKTVFSFPDYYGMNMDALWDCLYCGFDEPTLIVVKRLDEVPAVLKDSCRILRKVFQDLNQEDSYVEVSFL